MYYHPRRSLSNEDRVFKQRQYENALRDKINFVHKYENMIRYAQFEQANGPKTTYRDLAEKLEAIRSHREQVLNERRRRLSALLGNEEESINHEIRTGKMNLAERRAWLKAKALSESADKQKASEVHVKTSLEKALDENSDEVAMHNSRLAIMKIEAEKTRQNEDVGNHWHHHKDLNHSLECEEPHAGPCDEHAVDILRRHLHMVEQLREEEKMAVEEDLIYMNRRWLDEEEALRRQQVEQRHQQSFRVRETLQGGEGKKKGEEEFDDHMATIIAEREGEEEEQLEHLKEAHRREAKAYVSQLRTAVARQKFEDEELEALIKAEMEQPYHEPPFRGVGQGAEEDERKFPDDNRVSKKDLVDALEGQMRGLRAADLVDQETKRLAQEQGNKGKHQAADTWKRQTLAGLPHPEPYFGRKAVKWYE